MNSDKLFLGVDGGQSSTTALIGDESGAVLGVGTAGPCNHVGALEGAAKLKRTVLECVGSACEQAGLDVRSVEFEAACFGMSGGPADKETLLSETLTSRRWVVTDDAVIALAGALGGKPGVIAIAGTGSIAYGRNERGSRARAGGWGYIFGDEGAAFDIVRQSIRAALRYEEGWGPATRLKDVLLAETGDSDVIGALHSFYTTNWPRARVAAIAPHVDRLAGEGDTMAVGILDNAARQLAGLAKAVRGQLWGTGEPVTIAFIGGVFRSKSLLARFRSLLEGESGWLTTPPLLDPAAGALLEAYKSAGLLPPVDKLKSTQL